MAGMVAGIGQYDLSPGMQIRIDDNRSQEIDRHFFDLTGGDGDQCEYNDVTLVDIGE